MALNQPSKRKSAFPNSGGGGGGGGRDNSAAARKRAKTYDARALAVQTSDAALSATGELDVAAFVGAREYEIRALEAGMQRSKAALTSRAFQKVPRSLRRRTASHNVKRVPSRLRARAKREVCILRIPFWAFGYGCCLIWCIIKRFLLSLLTRLNKIDD